MTIWYRANPAAVQRILRHSDARVTEIYSHLLPNHLERGRNAVAFAPEVGPAIVKARQRWRTADVITDERPRKRRRDVR